MDGGAASKRLEKRILDSFASVAESIGYSPLHGKIIGVLLIEDRPISLAELAKKTGYSVSMVSLSLDFLEVMEVVKKIKKPGDRKLYVGLKGDLLSILRKAIVLRLKKVLATSLADFEESKADLCGLSKEEGEKVKKAIEILEKEIKRLDYYVDLLSQIELV